MLSSTELLSPSREQKSVRKSLSSIIIEDCNVFSIDRIVRNIDPITASLLVKSSVVWRFFDPRAGTSIEKRL